MRYVLIIALALAGCSSDPATSTTATTTAGATQVATTQNPVLAQGAQMPNASKGAPLANASGATSETVTIPQVDLGSPLPRLVINTLRFSDGSLLNGTQDSSQQVPNVNPGALPNTQRVGTNGRPLPSPTPVMQLMPNAPQNNQNSTLPTLLGVGHGGASVWALVNDNAHAILRIGDKIQNTTVVAISDDGVKLADGRVMTVSWDGTGGSSGNNGVPNIDTSQPSTQNLNGGAVLQTPPPPILNSNGPTPATAPPQSANGSTILPASSVPSSATLNQTLPATTPLIQNTPAAPTILH